VQIPLPVPFPLARGSLARERSPLLDLLGDILFKSLSVLSILFLTFNDLIFLLLVNPLPVIVILPVTSRYVKLFV
jgi:hypothetical protein